MGDGKIERLETDVQFWKMAKRSGTSKRIPLIEIDRSLRRRDLVFSTLKANRSASVVGTGLETQGASNSRFTGEVAIFRQHHSTLLG